MSGKVITRSDLGRGAITHISSRLLAALSARVSLGSWPLHLSVIFSFAVLAIVATWPLFPHLGGFVLAQDDPVQATWEMAWQAHALVTNPLHLLEANINYPFHSTLAFNEISFTEALMAAPLYLLFGNPILSHNFVILLAYIIGGYGAWLLAREITGSVWAGVVAGSAFAFSFYMLNNSVHTTLVSAEWLPFVLLAAYKVMWTGKWRWVVALGLFFALNALSSHYLAFYSAIMLGLFFLYYFIAQRRYFTLPIVGKYAAGLGLGALLVLPIAIPYAMVQNSYNFGRDLFDIERFSNTLESFLAVFQANPIYRVLLAPFADSGPWPVERSAFPGLTVLVLTVIGFIWALRKRRTAKMADVPKAIAVAVERDRGIFTHVLFFVLLTLVAVILSMGPTLQVTYASSVYDPSTVQGLMPLPYLLLYNLVPGFASMRVATRIDVLFALSLAVIASIGAVAVLRWLSSRFSGKKLARFFLPAGAMLLAILPVAESWSAPLDIFPIATKSAVPAVYRWLADQPTSVVLDYPMVLKDRGEDNVNMENLIQYYSVYDWQPRVNASMTIKPYAYSALIGETEDCFPCPRSVGALWMLGVKYVVVHLDNLTAPQRTDFEWRSTNAVGKVLDDFVLVQDFGSDRVYEIKAPSELAQLQTLIPSNATIQLGKPEDDPIISGASGNTALGGGYMATLGWYLRDHTLYGDSRLSFSQTIHAPLTAIPPDYVVLYANQDHSAYGYKFGEKVWGNEFVSLYKVSP